MNITPWQRFLIGALFSFSVGELFLYSFVTPSSPKDIDVHDMLFWTAIFAGVMHVDYRQHYGIHRGHDSCGRERQFDVMKSSERSRLQTILMVICI
ncbi:MAG: hypothetical protein JWQ02_55 [Capsulimonas sp.]|nr:hypothetical protein [Capsulimonas sp.]